MSRNQEAALGILAEIERARSGGLPLEELEYNIWRHLDATDESFPRILAGQIENLVQEIRELRRENLAFARGAEVDENQGADAIYHEVTSALGRYLG